MMSMQHELGGDSSIRGTHVDKEHLVILVIGKTGNGKSSLCNTILGETAFATGRSMSSTTKAAQEKITQRDGYTLLVVDTPDMTNLDWVEQRKQQEVQKWKTTIRGFLYVVLLAIRCDVRYTAEEYAIYRDFLKLWGDNSVKNRLVVAFTFGDLQERDIREELKKVCPELRSVLGDAGGRYVVFNDKFLGAGFVAMIPAGIIARKIATDKQGAKYLFPIQENAGRKAGMVGELLTKVNNIRDDKTPGPVWSWKESIILILLLVTGVLFACGVTKDIPALAAVFGLAYFVILAVIIWQKLQLTSVIIRLR